MQRGHHFAEYVELQLVRGAVADAHRLRVLIAGQPVELHLGQPALARDPVHDLNLLGRSGHHAAEPRAPRTRFVVVAAAHQREQRDRRVAQPAVAVVPVAVAADLLGQRRGGRGDDPAGRLVGERLQRDQRTAHGGRIATAHLAAARPFEPVVLGAREHRQRIARGRQPQMRGRIAERERHALVGADREFRERMQVLAGERHGRAQHDRVGAGDRLHPVFARELRDPRDREAVVEAQHEFHPHLHRAAPADDDAHELGPAVAGRHEVDDGHGAVRAFVIGFENQRVAAIAACRMRNRDVGGRRDQPATVLGCADERREAGARVEPGPAQPVDGAVFCDQRGRVAVADEGIVFDQGGHGRANPCFGFTMRAADGQLHALAPRPVYSIEGGAHDGRRFVLSQHLKRLDARRIQCPTVYASVTHTLRHEGSRLGSLTG